MREVERGKRRGRGGEGKRRERGGRGEGGKGKRREGKRRERGERREWLNFCYYFYQYSVKCS